MSQSPKILVIDDNDIDRSLLSNFLKKHGLDVISAASGEAGLELVEKENCNIVLLDVVMDGLDGNEVLKLLRKKFTSIELPIIMITGNIDRNAILESLNLGANDYIAKPIDFEITLMRIRTQLHIVMLSQLMSRLKEVEAVTAMVTTYNHEINNPLAVVLGSMSTLKDKLDEKDYGRVERALWRIADTVKKIEDLTTKTSIDYEEYFGKTKMIKIK